MMVCSDASPASMARSGGGVLTAEQAPNGPAPPRRSVFAPEGSPSPFDYLRTMSRWISTPAGRIGCPPLGRCSKDFLVLGERHTSRCIGIRKHRPVTGEGCKRPALGG